ncbi:MAG TPA: archease [Anaerolineae bacterium]|nr:archease [Anaerolineae bacterium]
MKRYEEIDHTADWAFRAFGRNLKDLYENAAYAIFELEGATDAPITVTRQVRVQGIDYEGLLVNWLNELLFLQETKNETYQQFKITNLTDTELEATIQGAAALPTKKFIKAVTYHDLKIERTPRGWQATVVVDV